MESDFIVQLDLDRCFVLVVFDLFSKKFDPRTRIIDLTGKVAVVTGSK